MQCPVFLLCLTAARDGFYVMLYCVLKQIWCYVIRYYFSQKHKKSFMSCVGTGGILRHVVLCAEAGGVLCYTVLLLTGGRYVMLHFTRTYYVMRCPIPE